MTDNVLCWLVDVEWSSLPECHVIDDGFGRRAPAGTFREAQIH